MTDYSIEVEAPVERGEPEELSELLLEALGALGVAGPVTFGGPWGVGARFDVEALDAHMAFKLGLEVWETAVSKAGADFGPVQRWELVTVERLEQELDRPTEQLVGVSEIAEQLGVSKQRVSELRGKKGFPAPIAELAAGPVWKRSALERFVSEWERRPGRPPSRSLGEAMRKLDAILKDTTLARPPDLTRREREILVLLAEGRTIAKMADELEISSSTVRTHVRRIMDKLGVEHAQAVHAVESADVARR